MTSKEFKASKISLSTEDDLLLDELFDLKEQWKSHAALTWRAALGLAAFLDFVATVLPRQFRVEVDLKEVDTLVGDIPPQYEAFGDPISNFPYGLVLRYLDQNCGVIGFIFSIACFVEAIFDAQRARDRTLLERDRQRLLRIKCDQDDEDSISLIEDLGYLDYNYDSWVAFYLRVLWQLMLLPVGFYCLISQGLFLEAKIELGVVDVKGGRKLQNMFRDTYDVDAFKGPSGLSRDKNLSLGFAIGKRFMSIVSAFANTKGVIMNKALHREIFQFGRQMVGHAIRNPVKFMNFVKKALTLARWVKYLQPIFGTAAKLKGNLADLTKKYTQRHQALLMKKVRWRITHQMTTKERREYSARRIQSAFRGHQTRKAIRALKILQGEKEALAAIKLQKTFRAKLYQARARIEQKRFELEKLKAKVEADLVMKVHDSSRMSPTERRRLYELEEDVQLESARLLNQRLLLKPNTTFAVNWKLLFCLCVVFEITGLVFNPLLKKHKNSTGEPLSMHEFFKRYMIPVPVSELEECTREQAEVAQNWIVKQLNRFKRKQSFTDAPLPSYCRAPYATVRSIYIQIMEFIFDEFLWIVGVVVFLDVPISFFTGEIDEKTGAIVPKPFIERWIVPGLVLQLLVNPKMTSVSKMLWRLGRLILEIGPVRVWRWTLALFYPMCMFVYDYAERNIWSPFVQDQNYKSLMSQATATVMRKHKDLEETVKKLSGS